MKRVLTALIADVDSPRPPRLNVFVRQNGYFLCADANLPFADY